MALTRKMLKAMGIEDEKIDQIIEAHTDVTDALKADRDRYKADAEKLPTVQKELDDTKAELAKTANDGYKEKYEKEHKEYEDYKKSIAAEQLKAQKVDAYRALLKKAGVAEKRIDTIIKVTLMDEIELDDKGGIKDSDARIKGIKEEYPEFITTEETHGAGTETPPSGAGAGGGRTPSRAAQVAQKHNEMVYGVKGDNK